MSHCIQVNETIAAKLYPDTGQTCNHNCVVSNLTFSSNHAPEKHSLHIVYLAFKSWEINDWIEARLKLWAQHSQMPCSKQYFQGLTQCQAFSTCSTNSHYSHKEKMEKMETMVGDNNKTSYIFFFLPSVLDSNSSICLDENWESCFTSLISQEWCWSSHLDQQFQRIRCPFLHISLFYGTKMLQK